MFLGRENVQRIVPPLVEPLSELKMEKRSLEVLEGLHVTTIGSVRTPVASLSGGQRQSVAISRAVMWNSKLVILDEPTAALGVAQTAQVIALIKRLREQGLGVVVISHNLLDVFEVADRIIVLRLGRRVATFRHDETTPEEVVAAITGARQEAA
jgi:D-xylose transport system ATP-binding protein